MKKTIAITVTMLVAASVQAVTLTFSGNSAANKFLGLTDTHVMTTGAGSETASMTAYFLLASDLTDILTEGIIDEADFLALNLVKTTASGQTATSTSASGRVVTSLGISNSYAGVDYFVRIYATLDGKDYFMDLKNGGDTAFWTTAKDGANSVSEILGFSDAVYGGDTGKLGDWNKWVAVPEPATAGLAIAGLALLFKRRRK